MEGKISIKLRTKQHNYLQSISSDRAATHWASGLIAELLKMVHTQWIYRTSIVHKRTRDGLKKVEGANLRIDIRAQLHQGIRNLHPKDVFLANHTFQEINTWAGDDKKMWLLAIKTARKEEGE